MFGRNGWGGGKQNVITAEAVKAQASKDVMNLRREADTLRNKIEERKAELEGIQPLIDAKFKEREEYVERAEQKAIDRINEADRKEADLDAREQRLKKDRATLDEDRKGFERHIFEKEQAAEKKNADIIADRLQLDKERESLNNLVSLYNERIGEIEGLKAAVAIDRQALNDEIAAWDAKEKDLTKREDDLAQAKQLLAAARMLLEEQEQNVKNLIAEQRVQAKTIADDLQKVNDEKAKCRLLMVDIEIREKGIGDANKRISEEENRLHVWRAALDKKSKELDEREANIKQLEANR